MTLTRNGSAQSGQDEERLRRSQIRRALFASTVGTSI